MFDRPMPELKASFERNGFVIVKEVFEPERCEEMIDEFWRLMPDRFSMDDRRTWTGKIQDCCNNLPLYQRNGLLRYKDREGFRGNPAFARHIYSNPRLGKIFNGITGRSLGRVHIRGLHPVLPMPKWISINEAVGNRLNPQLDAPEQPRFKIPRPPQLPIPGHLDAHPIDVLMMVYLDRVKRRGGGLVVWPGSHRLLPLCFNSLYEFFPNAAYKRCMNFLQRFRPVQLSGNQGDVIIFHNRLLHSNSLNLSRRIRYAILIDAFGKDWTEQDRLWKNDKSVKAERKALASTKHIHLAPLARSIGRQLRFDPLRAFWSSQTWLARLVSAIAKDPLAEARRGISAKIRMRREGDCWIVVSQDPVHRRSPKLDAYGSAASGSFEMSLNGSRSCPATGGVLVERIEPRNGANYVEICGTFGIDHYVRIIRSRNPLDRSEILYSGMIEAGPSTQMHRLSFDLSRPAGEGPLPRANADHVAA